MPSDNGKNKCIPIELMKRNIHITAKGGVKNPKNKSPIALKSCAMIAIRTSPKNDSNEITTIEIIPGNSLGNSITPL
ncbi:hypothetical protein SDC9_156539 [bioreactor metagenome]|uniref:Uncharacterized protein n=1 Tax=bioreactor metagenome TaxID=1076179 RepID=A0A645F5U7_9ZZZZ